MSLKQKLKLKLFLVAILFASCSGLDHKLNPEKSFELALKKMSKNEYSHAEFYFEKASHDEKYKSLSYHFLAKIKLTQKSYRDLIVILEKYIAEGGAFDVRSRLDLAQAYYLENDFKNTLKHLKVAEKLKSKDEKILLLISSSHIKLKNYHHAQNILKTVKSLNPSNLEIFYQMAQVEFYLGDYNKAKNIALKTLSFESSIKGKSYLLLAEISLKIKDYKNAIKMSELAFENGLKKESILIKAESLMKLNQYAMANELYKKLVAVDPNNIELRYKIGLSYMANGDYSQANIEFKKVLTLDHFHEGTHQQMVMIYREIDDHLAAERYLVNLQSLLPKSHWVKTEIAKLSGHLKDSADLVDHMFNVKKENKREIANSNQRFIRVKQGDTLGNLAQEYLGSTKYWMNLLNYNRHLLKRPEDLATGMKLKIPGDE